MMELGTLGTQFGDIHSANDWELEWSEYIVEPPVIKTKYIAIPGRLTQIDATESLYGHITYENRKITWIFWKSVSWEEYDDFEAMIMSIHGQRLKAITDLDKKYYWIGRVSVTVEKDSYTTAAITIEMDAEPYKYNIETGEGRL
jgi:hypothetical protein